MEGLAESFFSEHHQIKKKTLSTKRESAHVMQAACLNCPQKTMVRLGFVLVSGKQGPEMTSMLVFLASHQLMKLLNWPQNMYFRIAQPPC